MISKIFTYTDIGPRNENQDNFGYINNSNEVICCIADGVGGNKNGKFVSKFVVSKFIEQAEGKSAEELYTLINKINYEVIKLQSKEDYSNMATTFTAFAIFKNKLYGYHIGDTRLCVLRQKEIKQLTKPHTSAYRAMTAGIINLKEYNNLSFKNILENAVGQKGMFIDTFSFELRENDRIIISTDGFHNSVKKHEILEMSISHSEDIEGFYKQLIDAVKEKELTDNNSFVLVEHSAS